MRRVGRWLGEPVARGTRCSRRSWKVVSDSVDDISSSSWAFISGDGSRPSPSRAGCLDVK